MSDLNSYNNLVNSYDATARVNIGNMEVLCFEIEDYANRIGDIFTKIDERMDNLSRYYQGDSCDYLFNYYSELKNNFVAIKDNINSYSDDLVELVKKLQSIDIKVANLFTDFSIDTKNKTKSIES